MSVRFTRRLFVSLIGALTAFTAFGANAQQNVKGTQVGIGTPIGGDTGTFVGPVIAGSTTESAGYVSDLPTTQKTESRPSQTIDRTGYHPSVKE
jgi:acyl dehydratase